MFIIQTLNNAYIAFDYNNAAMIYTIIRFNTHLKTTHYYTFNLTQYTHVKLFQSQNLRTMQDHTNILSECPKIESITHWNKMIFIDFHSV